jgi:ATP-binding cassette subfamily B protein
MDRAFYLRNSVGDLMSRCTNDLVAVQEIIAFFGLLIVDSSLTMASCLALMAVIDLPLTLAALIPLPLLSLTFVHFGRKVRGKAAQVQASLAHLTQIVQETLVGIRVVQSYNMQGVRRELYAAATDAFIRRNVELAAVRGLFYALLTVLAGLAAVVTLWMGGQRVVEGHLTLGGFVAFNTYLVMLSWPMMSLGFMVNLLQRGRASLDRLEAVFREQAAIRDGTKPGSGDPLGPASPRTPGAALRFQGVGFRYPHSSGWALEDICLDLPGGTRLGVTGPVGSGKSTLLELVLRIHDPTEGAVFLDGCDIRALPLSRLRRWAAWIAQEPFLFSESISANVAFARPGASPHEVDRAARLVRLDKDMDAFPEGWDTLVGERGIMLSGGQRQRVALARALLAAPRILVLDDAFAHLDAETESEVMANLMGALPGVTILFASHRVSTLRRAQRVVVLSRGRVVEEGPPEALARGGGYFQRICRRQEIMVEMDRWGEEAGR